MGQKFTKMGRLELCACYQVPRMQFHHLVRREPQITSYTFLADALCVGVDNSFAV